jgi:glutathione S-transferase
MLLHDSTAAPNPRRVRIFIAEKGLTVPLVQVDMRKGEHKSADFLAKNPSGKIPVLELDDGTCIAESVAICRYFEEIQPSPPLFGRDAKSKAMVEMWNRRAELNFLLPGAQAFRNLTGFFKDREKISAEWGAISQEAAADALGLFDAALAQSRFLAGDTFSIADITFGCALDFMQVVQLKVPFDLPNVSRYREELASRPSWAAR